MTVLKAGLRVIAAAVAVGLTTVSAQQIWVGGGGGYGFSREAPRFAKPGDFDGGFM